MIIKIQLFIFQLIRSFLSIIKIILLSDLFIKKIKIKSKCDEALILGNGPSLKKFFKKEIAFMENKTIFAKLSATPKGIEYTYNDFISFCSSINYN